MKIKILLTLLLTTLTYGGMATNPHFLAPAVAIQEGNTANRVFKKANPAVVTIRGNSSLGTYLKPTNNY
jgi:hypothetical protein